MSTAPPADTYAASDTPSWRDVAWEGHVHVAHLERGSVNYVDLGARVGTPLVFLHGIAGCWQHWIQNLPRLAAHRRVIAVDLPGFGASPLPAKPITLGRYARVVIDLLDRLQVAEAVVIGNSLGAMVGVEIAAREPERVARLVLVSPAGVSAGSISRGLEIGARLATLQSSRFLPVLRRGVAAAGGGHPLELIVMRPAAFERGLLRAALAPGPGGGGFERVALHLAQRRLSGGLLGRASEVRCPTLLVWGRGDRVCKLADADIYAERIAGARVEVIDDAGHIPQLEHPRRFNELVLDFVG